MAAWIFSLVGVLSLLGVFLIFNHLYRFEVEFDEIYGIFFAARGAFTKIYRYGNCIGHDFSKPWAWYMDRQMDKVKTIASFLFKNALKITLIF